MHLYIPDYVELNYPKLMDFSGMEDELYLPPNFEILGSVATWSEAPKMQKFFDDPANKVQHLSNRIQTFNSQSELHSAVLRLMRERKNFVFLYWDPDMLSSISYYKIKPITTQHGNWGEVFLASPIFVAYRRDIRQFYQKRLTERSYQRNNSDLRWMLTNFSLLASPILEEEPTYSETVQHVSRQFICERLKVTSCADEVHEPFPRDKIHESWPKKLVVYVKPCQPFVGDSSLINSTLCTDIASAANNNMIGHKKGSSLGIEGYSIEHMMNVIRLLGYKDNDIVLRCSNFNFSTDNLVNHASRMMADFVVSCITIRDERLAKVDFTAPYFSTGYKILVKARRESTTISEALRLSIIFTPFTRGAWAVLMLILVFLIPLVLLYSDYDTELHWRSLADSKSRAAVVTASGRRLSAVAS